jgi:AcrR family transcriptional regulator
MSVLAGQGDPRRSIALLWREIAAGPERQAPGPKPGLTVNAIVEQAIAIADADGIAGLSMRAVAERLGVTAMALYTYVPSKRELVDLMYDGAHAELRARGARAAATRRDSVAARSVSAPAGGDQQAAHDTGEHWRGALMSWADELMTFYLRHPWVLQVSYARPVLGPHEQQVLEDLVRILRETGLPPGTLRGIVSVLFHVVRGVAQTIAESRVAATAGEGSERQWWSQRAAALNEIVPDFAQRYPMSTWLASEPTTVTTDAATPYLEHETTQALSTGLAVLLDGIDAALHDDRP